MIIRSMVQYQELCKILRYEGKNIAVDLKHCKLLVDGEVWMLRRPSRQLKEGFYAFVKYLRDAAYNFYECDLSAAARNRTNNSI